MATYADVSKEIAATILSDTVFTNRAAAVEERSEEFNNLIRERILEEAAKVSNQGRVVAAEGEKLQKELIAIKEESQSNVEAKLIADGNITSLKNQLREVQQELTTITQERDKLFTSIEAFVKSGNASQAELETIKEKLQRWEARRQRMILLGLTVLPVIASLAFYWNSYWLRWGWLQNHPNREKLMGGAYLLFLIIFIFAGCKWVWRKSRKEWIFFLLGLAVSIIIAIIDWA